SVTATAQTAVEGVVHDKTGKAVSSAKVLLQRAEGSVAHETTTDAAGKFRLPAVESGDYVLKTEATGFYPAVYNFTLRSRQPITLQLELTPRTSVEETVQVHAGYLTVDPEKTGSSYTFTSRELDSLPAPLVDSTNDLVNNLMPGASDSHDNFLAVRGTEFSLLEFTNGVAIRALSHPH